MSKIKCWHFNITDRVHIIHPSRLLQPLPPIWKIFRWPWEFYVDISVRIRAWYSNNILFALSTDSVCDQTQVFSPAQPKQRTSFLWLYASHCACALCAAQSFKIHCSQIFVVACKHTSPFMNQHNQYCLQTWFQIPQYNCHYNCNNNFRYKTNIVFDLKKRLECFDKILHK